MAEDYNSLRMGIEYNGPRICEVFHNVKDLPKAKTVGRSAFSPLGAVFRGYVTNP